MAKHDSSRGFSGLSSLASGSGVAAEPSSPSSGDANPRPGPQGSTPFPAIEISKWPTMPGLFSSAGSGETWVWGDFFMTFQTRPKMMVDVIVEMRGGSPESRAMTYHYAMSAFYRLDMNPRGPSHCPVMVVALEQADMTMAAAMLQGDRSGRTAPADHRMGPLMVGVFQGGSDGRANLGEYKGEVTPDDLRTLFFDVLGRRLGLTGQARRIGTLADAHGHPETGLPGKKGVGCASAILACGGLVGVGAWAWRALC